MTHVETVQGIYEAFARGDVPAILDRLAEDVEWEYGGSSTNVPWLQPRSGRSDVIGFFQSLRGLEFHRFVPTLVLGQADIVLALIDIEATVIATGKKFEEIDEVHIWRFDAQGKVRRFRHRADTHLQHLAVQS